MRDILKRFSHPPRDVVALDVASTGIKAVRMRRAADGVHLLAADILPIKAFAPVAPGADQPLPPLQLSKAFRSRYAAVAVSGHGSSVKLLTFPGHFDQHAEAQIPGHMGIEDESDNRIGYKVIAQGHGRSESRVLAVALPEQQARIATQLLPAGIPAPVAIEVSGLSALTAFLNGPALEAAQDPVGVLECGARVTFFALFNAGLLALVRKFEFGTEDILAEVEKSLGVTRETAQEILAQESIDISHSAGAAMDRLLRQLIVSRDFVERRENCHIRAVYVSGGAALSPPWLANLRTTLEVESLVWNPFETLKVAQGALPATVTGMASRFAAAVGAGLAALEEQ